MNWKIFLKPTHIKVFLFLLFFIIASFILPTNLTPVRGMNTLAHVGFPFPIFSVIKKAATAYQFQKIYFSGLIGNIIVWYIASSSVVYLYNKKKVPPNKN